MIDFPCTNCDTIMESDENHIGSEVECPDCGTKLIVPTNKTKTRKLVTPAKIDGKELELPESAPRTTPPPTRSGPAGGGDIQQKLLSVAGLVGLFFKRFSSSDFQKITPTENELAVLGASQPGKVLEGTDNSRQSYMVWRRSLLWIAGVCLAFTALFSTIDLIQQLSQESPAIIVLISLLTFAAQIGGVVFVFLAARSWDEISGSRRFARIGWASMFVVPFLIACIPISMFMGEQPGVDPMLAKVGAGALFAISLMPIILGLFPGLLRASLAVKTLFPELTLPGWVALTIAPLYSLFFMVSLVIAVQLTSFLGIVATLAMVIGPIFLIIDAKKLVSPMSGDEVDAKLGPAKTRMRIATGIAISAMIILMAMNYKDLQINFFQMFRFLVSVLASLLVVLVVFADFLVAMMRVSFMYDQSTHSPDRSQMLADRFSHLDDAAKAIPGSIEHRLFGDVNPPSQ